MASREQLNQSWERTRSHLGRATALLPPDAAQSDSAGRIDRYFEYLGHNELQLALDELEGIGENNEVSNEYWLELRSAAQEMGLEVSVQRIDQRLATPANPEFQPPEGG